MVHYTTIFLFSQSTSYERIDINSLYIGCIVCNKYRLSTHAHKCVLRTSSLQMLLLYNVHFL